MTPSKALHALPLLTLLVRHSLHCQGIQTCIYILLTKEQLFTRKGKKAALVEEVKKVKTNLRAMNMRKKKMRRSIVSQLSICWRWNNWQSFFYIYHGYFWPAGHGRSILHSNHILPRIIIWLGLALDTRLVMWLMFGPDFRVMVIERIHSHVQQLWKFILTKESVYLSKALTSHKIGLVRPPFLSFWAQYGCHDVMWKL